MADAPLPGEKPKEDRSKSIVTALLIALGILLVGIFSPLNVDPDRPEGIIPPREKLQFHEFVELTRLETADSSRIQIPWRPKLTVLDATHAAEAVDPAHWASSWRGEGEMAFLTTLGGIENQGSAGRNWLFSVNGEQAQRGAGAIELKAGDRVLWEFAEYQ